MDFLGSYHAILGWTCYAKFMAVPNYTYLKLKMLGPNDIITVGSTFSHAFMCDREHYELTTTVINSSELLWLGELSTPAVLDCNKPTSLTSFCPLEETSLLQSRTAGVNNSPSRGSSDKLMTVVASS